MTTWRDYAWAFLFDLNAYVTGLLGWPDRKSRAADVWLWTWRKLIDFLGLRPWLDDYLDAPRIEDQEAMGRGL